MPCWEYCDQRLFVQWFNHKLPCCARQSYQCDIECATLQAPDKLDGSRGNESQRAVRNRFLEGRPERRKDVGIEDLGISNPELPGRSL